MHLYRARESKFVLPEIIWHYCFFELSLSRHRSLNNSCELNPHLEFSGLHYCLFVKEHLLCCLLLSHATAYLDYHIVIRLSTTFSIFFTALFSPGRESKKSQSLKILFSLVVKRRKRDLNPRAGCPTYTLSRGASSAS